MKLLKRLAHELGPLGLGAVALLALTSAFLFGVLKPQQEKAAALGASLGRYARTSQQEPRANNLEALYRHLEKAEAPTDWLAKLHAIGTATGVELRSATYRSQPGGGRVERYEIVLPASGSYAQIRDFLTRALGEIPVLSLDQIALKRDNRETSAVQAELRLTLHLLRPS